MNERWIFGLILPSGIFIISLVATWLVYRRFARRKSISSPDEEGNSK